MLRSNSNQDFHSFTLPPQLPHMQAIDEHVQVLIEPEQSVDFFKGRLSSYESASKLEFSQQPQAISKSVSMLNLSFEDFSQ